MKLVCIHGHRDNKGKRFNVGATMEESDRAKRVPLIGSGNWALAAPETLTAGEKKAKKAPRK